MLAMPLWNPARLIIRDNKGIDKREEKRYRKMNIRYWKNHGEGYC
jgi:hypothetical protein